MSSWKSYGGINNFDKRGSINADSLTVNNMTLKHKYKGNFDICGQLNIDGGITVTKDVDISGSLVVSANATIGSSDSFLNINSSAIFNGPAQFNNSFSTIGNIVSIQDLIATKDVIVGNSIYLTNGNINSNNGPFIFGNGSYIGINTFKPIAALDISTNLVRGLNINSYNNTNENIIANNLGGYGVSAGADLSSSHIYFYADHNPYSGISDGQISYLPGGYLNIDVSQNVNILSQMTVSTNPTTTHNHGEMFSVYDISQGVYFGNIYMNQSAYSGPAASFIADSNNSNTFVYVGTPGGVGGSIGGGAYPSLINRGMTTIGLTDTSGNYTPAQTIVSGNVLSRYYTTTGVNTFKPRIDNYVLDVNGPIHIDNSDIVDSTGSIQFEIYSMSRARDNNNVVAALGSSIDISGDSYLTNNPGNFPRERIIYTVNGGKKWAYIDISNEIGGTTNILKGNALTGIHLYNSQQWFISGYNSQLITTFDGGSSWQNINTPNSITGNFNNIYINKTPNSITGNLIGYFTNNNIPNNLYIFDISAGVFNNSTDNINIAGNTTIIGNVSSIKADTNTLYIAGNGIATYNITPTVQQIPKEKYIWNTNYYYKEIKVYDNSYAIAVGGNIISSTVNGGANWKDTYFSGVPGFNSVHLIDSQNAITVGSQGNIWLTSNRGNTWYPIPLNLINSSGKAGWLLSSNVFRNITMTDNNTILITNTVKSYNFGLYGVSGSYGESNIFSLFAPNLVNASNNFVLDISGTVRISGGDIQINDGGSILSNNSILNIANTGVQTIYLGGAATNIVIGNALGNTTINNNINISGTTTFNGNNVVTGAFSITNTTSSTSSGSGALVVGGGAGIGGNLNIGGFSNFSNDVSFNGSLVVNKSTASNNTKTGAVVINGGVGIGGNLNIGGSLGLSTDLNLPGNITVNQITLTSGNLLSNTGRLNLSTLTNPSVSKNTGAVVVGGGVGIGGNLNIGGGSNFTGDVSITSQTLSTGVTTGALTVVGGVGIGQTLNVGGSVTSSSLIVTSGSISSSSNNINIIGTNGTTTYTIGSNSSDVLIVNGKIQGTLDGGQTIQTSSSNPTFVVNQRSGNAVSGFAGIDIYDNSGNVSLSNDSYCIANKVFGYIHVGSDLQSYILKAPSIGLNKNTQSIYQISKENRLRIGVNELNLWDISKNVTRGLVMIQSDTDFRNYQSSKGHSYSTINDADYAINICPDFDISNIMLKNFDSITGTQTIGSNVSVLGNITNGNLFVTNTMNLSGTGLFSGNIGIGTSAPLLGLDVSGSSRFVGSLVSTNYDTLRFLNNYGYGWKDNLNTAVISSYYQDIASSYDGAYEYALMYNKNGFGSVNISSNSGSSWTSVQLPSSYAGNVIYQAVPFMNNATGSGTLYSQTYRFQDLAGNISLPNAIPLNIQVGTYIASASSITSPQNTNFVFDNSNSTYWQSTFSSNSQGYYNSTYQGPFYTNGYNGEYVQINLPYSFILTNILYYPLPSGISYNNTDVKTMYIFGSNNNTNWIQLSQSTNTMIQGSYTFVSIYNNQSYNSYRFVITNTYQTTSSYVPVSISRIDISGIFQNITGSFSSSIATSGSGQYATVANQGYYPGTGNLFITSNYGQVGSWTDTNQQATAVWQGITISQTGQIQAAIEINRSCSGNIYLSNNYGQTGTWNPVTQLINTTNGWQTISMSSTGQYITAIQASTFSSPKGNIWISADGGSTWSSNYSIYNYTQTVNSFLNLGTADFNKTVCVSSSGKYQTALGLAPSSNPTSSANIWTSSDYGISWNDTGYRAPSISGSSSILTSISMTGSGQNQVISYVGGNTGSSQPSTTTYGNILVSSDYGASWTDTKFKAPTEKLTGNTYYGYVSKVQSTMNGQYVIGVSKYADISGNTYNNNNSTAGGVGNVFLSSVPTSNNLLINQYFGSPYTNSVNQTHGIQVSVPTVNNASLIMGYDINYDSGYINSADQNGANFLGINTNGGFVGIGKIVPTAALDVSGNLIVSGGLTIGGTTNFSANSTFNTIGVTSSTNGALHVVGGVGIGGNLNVGGFSNFVSDSSFNGNLLITSTNASSNSNNGALRVSGGAGIGGNLNVGGFSNFVFDSSFNGNVIVNKNIITYGNIGIRTNTISQYALNVGGSANVSSLYIGGTQVNFNPSGQWLSSNNNIYYTSGNVGIGTNNPGYPLQVSGRVSINTNSQNAIGFSYSDIQNPNQIFISGNLGSTSFNNLSQTGDIGIIYSNVYSAPSCGLVIGPYNGTGIKINSTGQVGIGGQPNSSFAGNVTGIFTQTSTNSPYAASNLPSLQGGSINALDLSSCINIHCNVFNNNGYNGPRFIMINMVQNGYNNYIYQSYANFALGIGQGSNYASALDINIGGYNASSGGYSQTTAMTILSQNTGTANVGINNTNPSYTLDVNGTIKNTSDIIINNSTLARLLFNPSGCFIATNTTNNLYLSTPTGTNNSIIFQAGSNTTYQGSYSSTGQMTAASFNAYSDYRIKRNVKNLTDDFYIDKLRPVHYDISGGQGHDMGFIAHEVQEIFPFLVTGVKDGEEKQTLNYNGFIALLVKEVQDLKKENIDLKSRLDAIEKRFM